MLTGVATYSVINWVCWQDVEECLLPVGKKKDIKTPEHELSGFMNTPVHTHREQRFWKHPISWYLKLLQGAGLTEPESSFPGDWVGQPGVTYPSDKVTWSNLSNPICREDPIPPTHHPNHPKPSLLQLWALGDKALQQVVAWLKNWGWACSRVDLSEERISSICGSHCVVMVWGEGKDGFALSQGTAGCWSSSSLTNALQDCPYKPQKPSILTSLRSAPGTWCGFGRCG